MWNTLDTAFKVLATAIAIETAGQFAGIDVLAIWRDIMPVIASYMG